MANEIDINIGTFDLNSSNGVSIEDIGITINKSIVESALPKYNGSIIPIGKRKSISVRIKGNVVAADYDALRTAMDSLKNAFDDTAEKKFTTDDDRQIFVQYKSFGYSWRALRTFATFTVELVASNPYWLSQTLQADSRTPTTTVGYTLANAGNAPARAKVTITQGGTPVVDDILVTNSTTGESFLYRGTVAATKALVVNNKVDTNDLVVTNDGTSDFANFEGDFMTLAPGNNTIVVTSAVMGTVLFNWRDTYK